MIVDDGSIQWSPSGSTNCQQKITFFLKPSKPCNQRKIKLWPEPLNTALFSSHKKNVVNSESKILTVDHHKTSTVRSRN